MTEEKPAGDTTDRIIAGIVSGRPAELPPPAIANATAARPVAPEPDLAHFAPKPDRPGGEINPNARASIYAILYILGISYLSVKL